MKFSNNSLMKVIIISDKKPEFTAEHSLINKVDLIYLDNDENLVSILKENKQVDAIVTQFNASWSECGLKVLPYLGQEIAIKWFHFEDYENHGTAVYNEIMSNQLNGIMGPLFSIITPLYKTKPQFFIDAYKSLCAQTLNAWEWILIDDSPIQLNNIKEMVENLNDIRVKYYRIEPTDGNIGLSKWRGFSLSTGYFLVELDHDDLLTPNALKNMKDAFDEFPDCGFVYSDYQNIDINGNPIKFMYSNEYAFGFGHPQSSVQFGDYDESPNINSATIRHIVGVPNHVRCWKRNVYFGIGGHNQYMRIADDYELLVRTFLVTRFVRINAPIYKQRFYENNSQDAEQNRYDIQRRVNKIANFYNELIHRRMIQLVGNDIGYKENTDALSIANNIYLNIDANTVSFVNRIFTPVTL